MPQPTDDALHNTLISYNISKMNIIHIIKFNLPDIKGMYTHTHTHTHNLFFITTA